MDIKKHFERTFFPFDREKTVQSLGREHLISALKQMLLIRNFELRAESAYLQGLIGGFFHSYMGQEAIQIAAMQVIGQNNWFITSYRCHALALLLGATPNEIMAELYGKAAGNAKGRGGSMHLYTERLLGGFGIVTNQVPVATGAAFTIKYLDQKEQIAICFLGDGAVAQGVFHESLNIAALWSLPCLYVIENNQWGMGTHVSRAVSAKRLAEDFAPAYNMSGYTFNGMDFIACYAGFKHVHEEMLKTGRPILVEAVTERFKGHSISDPALYRTKDELKQSMTFDPINILRKDLEEHKWMDDETFKKLDQEAREVAIASMKYAEHCAWPDPVTLEEDVFAPQAGGK